MEKEKHTTHLSEVLSPSKITDYFCPKTDIPNGILHGKESCDNKSSSVYLTPKSSPVKENEDNFSPTKNIQISDESDQNTQIDSMTALNNKHNSCEQVEVNNISESATESPEKSTMTINSCNDECTSSHLNGFVSDLSTSDTSKRKSNQHRICQITRSSSLVSDKDNSSQASSVESSAISSPSLPRPKVRKNSKPRTTKADSQPATNVTTQSAGAKPKSGRRKKPEPIQNTAITDYFPIRRSGRQTKSQIEKETQIHVEKLIMCKCEDGLEVKEFEEKGRGVVATKVFDKGDYVVEYAGDLLDIETARKRESKYAETPAIGCYMYFFNHKNKQYCIDATSESGCLGRLINHSRSGNCGTKVVMLDGQPHLILIAAKHIKQGEELCYDYGDRSKAALDAHPWLKL